MCTDVCTCGRSKLELGLLVLQDFLPEQLQSQRKKSYSYSCKGRRATATSAKEELQLQRKKSYSCKAKRGDGLQFIQYRTVPANNTYAPSDQTGNSDEHVSFLRVRCKSMRFV